MKWYVQTQGLGKVLILIYRRLGFYYLILSGSYGNIVGIAKHLFRGLQVAFSPRVNVLIYR
jgi:hypothetical protein